MPIVSNIDDQEKNPAQGPITPSGTGVPVAAASGVGGAASPTPTQPGQPGTGGGFATLDKYLTANQSQAQPLANQIVSGIGQQYNTLQGQNASTLQGIGQQVANAPGYTPSNPSIFSAEAANPVSFASDPGNVQQFQGMLTNTYGGPTSAQGTPEYTKQQNAINQAIAQGQSQTGTSAGREQLLQNIETAPSTSVTGLNEAILSQSPTAQSQVEQAYKPFSSLLTNLYSGAQDTNQQIAREQADAAASSVKANKQISDQISGLNANVNQELAGAQNAYNQYNTLAGTTASALQGGNLPTGLGVDQGLQAFLSGPVGQWLKAYGGGQGNLGVNAPPTYNFANAVPTFPTANAPTIAQAATPQDYAQAQAFQNLIAGLNTGIAAPTLNPTTANEAGTYATPTLPNVNNQTLASDIFGSLQPIVHPQPYYNPTGFNQFYGLLAALNQYQGKPWYAGTGNVSPGPVNPYQQYTPTIA
jgi:hypothetical protein